MTSHLITVLIIDDSEVDRYTYRRYLQIASPLYQVYEAANRLQGIALAKTANLDCVILDLTLPNDYGIEILQELVASHPKLPVIVLAVSSNKLLQDGALSIGASKYLIKSKNTGPLLDQAIREVIDNV